MAVHGMGLLSFEKSIFGNIITLSVHRPVIRQSAEPDDHSRNSAASAEEKSLATRLE